MWAWLESSGSIFHKCNGKESMEAGNNHGKEKRLCDDTRMKISELEGWMKQRTFRREEADRLIDILKSSVVDNGVDTKKAAPASLEVKSSTPNMLHGTRLQANEAQPSNSLQSDEQRLREELRKNWQEQKLNFWPHGFGKENGTPSTRGSEDVEVLDASPIDLARAYMDERAPRVRARERTVIPQRFSPYQQRAPSSRWLRKDLQHDNSQLRYGVTSPYQHVKPPIARPTSLGMRGIQESVLEDKVFSPPVCQALDYLPPVHHFTPPGSALGLSGTEGSKKRRATALDGADYSSGGPMRRLRQRSSLYTPSPARSVQKQPGLDQFPPPPARTLQTMEAKQNQSTVRSGREGMPEARKSGPEMKITKDEERRGSAVPPGGHSFVPVQSSETARKILETLERMTPSPRGKSLEEELALVREQPPTVLTSSMLNDKASLTMQTWKFPDLHEVEDAGPSDSNVENDVLSVEESARKATDYSPKLKGNGKAPLFDSTEVSYENAADQTPDFSDTVEGSTKETQESCEAPEPDLAVVGPITSETKGFRMSAAFDESGSDDESQAVPTTSTVATVNPVSQFISSDSVHTKPLPTITSPIVGSPASLETETHVTLWNCSSSQAGSPGDFTFPSSTLPGAFLEPPSTPKPFPSAAINDGGQPLKYLSDPTVNNWGTLGATEDTDPSKRKLDFKFDSKPEFIFSAAAAAAASGTPQSPATQDSPLESSKSAEIMTESEVSPTIGVLTSNSLFPHTSLATKASLFSTSSFSSAAAGSETGNSTSTSFSSSAGHTPTSEQHTTSSPPDKPGLDGNLLVTTNVNTSIFGFSSTTSTSVPPAQPTANAGTSGNISGSNVLASSAAPLSPFIFGSSSAFELSKSPFQFGAKAVPPSHTSSPATNSTDADDMQERVGHQDVKKSRSSGNMSGLSFGLTVTSSTSTVVPAEAISGGSSAASSSSTPSQGLFSIPAFGQSMSSSTPALPGGSAAPLSSLFGLSPATTALSAPTPITTMTPTPFSFGSNPTGFGAITGAASSFGTMTSSAFGSSTLPTLTGALSTPAFGVKSTNNQMFASFSNDVKAQPSPVTPVFGSGFGAPVNLAPPPPASTFSFEAPSTTSTSSTFAFGSSGAAPSSAFSFGASSGSSASNPFLFGAKPELSSPPMFRPVTFGTPLFGASPNTAMASDIGAENHMEDSMAEEPPSSQMAPGVAPPQQTPPLFGAPHPTGSGNFLFGQQSSTPAGATTPVFSFGAQPSPAVENAFAPAGTTINPFASAPQQPNTGGLKFSASPFALGSSGQDTSSRTNRKFIKAKRTGTTKRR